MKKAWFILLLFGTNAYGADPTKTKFNPFTGKPDFITNVSSLSVGNFLDISTGGAADGKALIWKTTEFAPAYVSSITQAISVRDEGSYQAKVSSIDCVGAGVTCSASDDLLTITVIPGGAGGSGGIFVSSTAHRYNQSASTIIFIGPGISSVTFNGTGVASVTLNQTIFPEFLVSLGSATFSSLQSTGGINVGASTMTFVKIGSGTADGFFVGPGQMSVSGHGGLGAGANTMARFDWGDGLGTVFRIVRRGGISGEGAPITLRTASDSGARGLQFYATQGAADVTEVGQIVISTNGYVMIGQTEDTHARFYVVKGSAVLQVSNLIIGTSSGPRNTALHISSTVLEGRTIVGISSMSTGIEAPSYTFEFKTGSTTATAPLFMRDKFIALDSSNTYGGGGFVQNPGALTPSIWFGSNRFTGAYGKNNQSVGWYSSVADGTAGAEIWNYGPTGLTIGSSFDLTAGKVIAISSSSATDVIVSNKGMLAPSATFQYLNVSQSSIALQTYTLVLASGGALVGDRLTAFQVNGTNIVAGWGKATTPGNGGGGGGGAIFVSSTAHRFNQSVSTIVFFGSSISSVTFNGTGLATVTVQGDGIGYSLQPATVTVDSVFGLKGATGSITGNVAVGSLTVTGPGAGIISLLEGSDPDSLMGYDFIYADVVSNWPKIIPNATTGYRIVGTSVAITPGMQGHSAVWSTGNVLMDGGTPFSPGPFYTYTATSDANSNSQFSAVISSIAALSVSTNTLGKTSIGMTFDGGGSAIAASTSFAFADFAATIVGWTVVADTTGSIKIDVKKCAGFICNPVTSIAGSEKPTITSDWASQDLSLGSWTTAIAVGDKISFNVDENATITRASIYLRLQK